MSTTVWGVVVSRPVLSLVRYWGPLALSIVIVLILAVVYGLHSRLLPVGIFVVIVIWARWRWAWSLAFRVRRFRTLATGSVVLHFDPEVASRYDLPALMGQCEADLSRLAAWFGRPLRGRPIVYLFAHSVHFAGLFGRGYGGAAVVGANVVVVAAGEPVREAVRHEFAHLFAARWNPYAPTVLSEGLAVWIQGTDRGEPIDAGAWGWVGEPGLALRNLLSPQFFFAEP